MKSFAEALDTIVFYNGYDEWLMALATKIENFANDKANNEDNYLISSICKEDEYEDETILQLLIAMFGDWGTSVRTGWIPKENCKACADFILTICKTAVEAMEYKESEYKG